MIDKNKSHVHVTTYSTQLKLHNQIVYLVLTEALLRVRDCTCWDPDLSELPNDMTNNQSLSSTPASSMDLYIKVV